MRKFFREFKEFISRGSVIDLAIGIVIGTAFTAIVTSLVNDIIMPLVVAIFGKGNVSELSVTLNNSVISYGVFIQAVINFLLISFFLFLVIKAINTSRNLAEKGKSRHVTAEERAEIEKSGTVDMTNRKAVYQAALELRERRKAEEETKKQAEEDAKVTTEKLLAEIRDLLANGKAPVEKKATQKKTK